MMPLGMFFSLELSYLGLTQPLELVSFYPLENLGCFQVLFLYILSLGVVLSSISDSDNVNISAFVWLHNSLSLSIHCFPDSSLCCSVWVGSAICFQSHRLHPLSFPIQEVFISMILMILLFNSKLSFGSFLFFIFTYLFFDSLESSSENPNL